MRQGDPISPYLFILVVEILAQIIRDDLEIRGFYIQNEEIKIIQYADDTSGCLADLKSGEKFLSQIETFGKFSGLKLNREKTEGMWLGSFRFRNDSPLGISWTNKPIRILGVYLSYDDEANDEMNFENKLKKCKLIMAMWKGRNLTLFGRVLIIKTFIISQFLFVGSAIIFPMKYQTRLNKMVNDFIWGGKKPKLKKEVLYMTKDLGGLGLPNINSMVKTSLLKWVNKYQCKGEHSWKFFFREYMQLYDIKLDILLQSNYDTKYFSKRNIMPMFYISVLEAWEKYGNTESKEQFLWYNKHFIINKKLVWYSDFYEKGIHQIKDICNNEGDLLDFNDLVRLGVKPTRWFAWLSLVTSMKSNRYLDIMLPATLLIKAGKNVLSIGKKELASVKAKYIYEFIEAHRQGNKGTHIPRVVKYLDNENIDWKQIYCGLYNMRIDMRSVEFQFKFVNDILINNFWLSKWQIIASNLCQKCQEVEDLEHYYWNCVSLQGFLNHYKKFLLTNFDCILLKAEFFLGQDNPTVSHMYLLCKQYIYKTKRNGKSPIFKGFINYVSYVKSVELNIAMKKNVVEKWSDKWENIEFNVV